MKLVSHSFSAYSVCVCFNHRTKGRRSVGDGRGDTSYTRVLNYSPPRPIMIHILEMVWSQVAQAWISLVWTCAFVCPVIMSVRVKLFRYFLYIIFRGKIIKDGFVKLKNKSGTYKHSINRGVL